jgi:type II secretory pathway pseudopilin PulG
MLLTSRINDKNGYTLLILLFVIAALVIGLMVAVPVWQTQIQREREEELIFRGNQYIEAVRIHQLKNPGKFPETLEALLDEKCIRRLYTDPMTPSGEWNLILLYSGAPSQKQGAPQKILIAPQNALSSVSNPQIIGVVSASTKRSIKIYNEQETYDMWLFYYGQDPDRMPEIIYHGQEAER